MLSGNCRWVLFINYDHPTEEKWYISIVQASYPYDTLKHLFDRGALHMYKPDFYFVSIEI